MCTAALHHTTPRQLPRDLPLDYHAITTCPPLPASLHPASSQSRCVMTQAQHLESYFAQWRSLEGLVHAVACEDILKGPLTEAACELAEGRRCEAAPEVRARVHDELPDEPLIEELVVELEELRLRREAEANVTYDVGEATLNVSYFDLLPRVPAKSALAAAKLRVCSALRQASPEERSELPGTLTWLLFSPTTRDGAQPHLRRCEGVCSRRHQPIHRHALPVPLLAKAHQGAGCGVAPSTAHPHRRSSSHSSMG